MKICHAFVKDHSNVMHVVPLLEEEKVFLPIMEYSCGFSAFPSISFGLCMYYRGVVI